MSRHHGLALGPLLIAALPALAWAQPVGPEFQVNTYTTFRQYSAAVASDASGNFVVVWHSYQDGSYYGVFGQRFDSLATPVGSEFQVNTYTFDHQVTPVVATHPSGAFVVVWHSHSSSQEGFANRGVFGQRYDSGGNAAGPEFHVNTYTTNTQLGPAVAVNPNGDFVVVWHSSEQDGSSYGVFGQRYDATGSTQGGEFQVNTYTTAPQVSAAVAWLASGDFVVVWNSLTQDGSSWGVFGQRYDSSASPLGGEFQVNTATLGLQIYTDVAADANGNFVVVWGGEDGSNAGIFGQRFDSAGNPLGGEFQINTYTTGTQQYPSVASDNSGNFSVVWTERNGEDGSGNGVFGQRFDASGSPMGGEFQVNTFTTSSQSARNREAVASDPTGNLVVVWQSNGQDGSDFGVFGQRYASPTLTVAIDIRPGRFPNRINPTNKGLIPVAILTTPIFDATTVDPLSVAFGPNGAIEAHGKGHIEDVDGDGDNDMLLHFRTRETGIQCGDTSASLTGQTGAGQAIEGSDSIVTIECT